MDMKRESDFTCEQCGRQLKASELNCHHLTYKRLGRELRTDIEVLCEDCHFHKHHSWADIDRLLASI